VGLAEEAGDVQRVGSAADVSQDLRLGHTPILA
jgi:hypothetical protein